MSVSDLRKEYRRDSLDEANAARDPLAQFREWFEEAVAQGLPEPNAMTLATATPEGKPSSRIVLLKEFDDRGFVFYTNYLSRKGRELAANPFASLTFFYATMERQIRVEGAVARVSPDESDRYFASRPVGSRLGALVSRQSQVVTNREVLDARLAELEARSSRETFPRPEHWGGFLVVPDSIEFWQGRPNRLHDRLRYTLNGASWLIERLEP